MRAYRGGCSLYSYLWCFIYAVFDTGDVPNDAPGLSLERPIAPSSRLYARFHFQPDLPEWYRTALLGPEFRWQEAAQRPDPVD